MKALCLIALIIVGASATFDYTNCAKNSFQFFQSINAYVNNVQSGNFNIANLQQEINNLIDTSSAVIDNCPVPAQTIENLPTVSGNCLNDLKTLTQICEKAVNDYEAKNIFALVGDAQAILKEAKQTLADCKSAQIDATPKLQAITPECQASTVQYGLDLHRWVQLSKENLTPQVWNDFLVSTSQLLTDTTGLLDKCGINFKDDGSITYSISAACTKDITLLTADVEKAIKAYDSGNIIGLVKDAVEIIKIANKTIEDCTAKELEESIEIALINNPAINYEKCAKDAYNFVEACKKFVDDVQNGTDSHNLPLIISDVEGIVSSAQSLVVDCGFNTTFTAPLVDYKITNLDIVDMPHCQEAFDNLVVDVPQLIALLEANKFQAFSVELALFMKDIGKALNNCHSNFLDNLEIALGLNPTINYEKCAIDAYHFGQACYTFIQDVQNGTDSHNLPQILTDVQNIVTTAQALVTDCGLNQTETARNFLNFDASMISVANPITCAKDLETLTSDVQKAVKDYEAKNIAALVKDAEQIIVVANKTLIDCKSTLPAFAEKQLPIQIQVDLETCFADKNKYIAQLQGFIQFSMSGNLQDAAIAEQINTLLAVSQNMLDGCGIQIDLSQIVPLNAGNCIGDLINAAQLAGATIKDMLTLQYQAAAVDLVGLVSELSTAITDCVAQDTDSVANNIIFSCIHAADTFVTLIEQFQADYQKGDDFQVLVQDSGNIAQNIPVLLNTCGAGQAAAFYTKYLPDDCIVSLESTADAADKIYQVRNNFFEILRTLPLMADALESDLFTCPLLKPKFLRDN